MTPLRGFMLAAMMCAALAFTSVATAASAPSSRATTQDLLTLVDPFVGTTAEVNTFPGADAPFGMLQWSPDTPSSPSGGGYDYKDHTITGFSLTHLSGPGCRVFGNFPILPIGGEVTDPARAQQPFAHQDETASPGRYSVVLRPDGAQPITVELVALTRTGIGRFTFGPGTRASIVFKTGGSQAGDVDARFDVTSLREVVGSATSGHFCGSPDEFTVYFVAQFDRDVRAGGAWQNAAPPQAGATHSQGPASGGWVSVDTMSDPAITMRVGLSFVSIEGARNNLEQERTGWDLDAARARTEQAWRTALGRIATQGGTPTEQRIFYTALYHALLHPNVFSDADGSYTGFDDAIHHVRPGHTEYANFSAWDTYRAQTPLLAFLFPREAADMAQSLVDAGRQGGWLPRWPLTSTYTNAMNGDSADPVIAETYAFGARDFDARSALALMVKGAQPAAADDLGQGWYVARPDVESYVRNGYVANAHRNSISTLPNAASETLEYAIDDFAVSRLARALGDESTSQTFAVRSRNWSNLFDLARSSIMPRDADGAFVHTPIGAHGQSGFQEGNAAQYTWLVPHDVRGLFDAMGGDERAAQRLDDFFTRLNAGAGTPYAWFGNEPSILQPWLYLSARQPWKTQALVRTIETALYSDAPAGEAGNDDLGTLSAWYVWSAIGLYPQTPGTALLDIGSPLFSHVTMTAEDGRSIAIDASNAATANPYVQSLRVNGTSSTQTWLMAPLHRGTQLEFDLGPSPNVAWGSAAGDGPPSWGLGRIHLPPTTAAELNAAPSSVAIGPNGTATITISATNADRSQPATVSWHADIPPPLTSPSSAGTLHVPPRGSASDTLNITAASTGEPGFHNIPIGATADNGAPLHRAIVTVQLVTPGKTPDLAYVLDFSSASITPIDIRSRTFGPLVAVGVNPGDATLSPDGATLYVANQGSASISVVDVRSLTTLFTIPVGRVPAGIRITPDGKTVWVSDFGDDDVRAIDTATRAVSAPIRVGKKPEQIAITPDGRTLYVVEQGDDAVTPIDLMTRTVGRAIPVGRVPIGIAMSPNGKTAYVTNMGSNDVTPIDLPSATARPPIKVGMTPQLPAIAPDGELMYVPNSGSGTVTPVDLQTQKALPPIRVGNGPFSVTFTADGKTAFVADSGDNECVPIDVATRRAGTPIATGSFPIAVIR